MQKSFRTDLIQLSLGLVKTTVFDVIVQTGLGLAMELLRVVPLVLSCLYALLAPKHTCTRRECNSPKLGLRDIAQSDQFDPTTPLADCFLVLLVTLTFAPIAPLVCYFTWFFFFVAEIVYHRQVLYMYKPMCFASGHAEASQLGFINKTYKAVCTCEEEYVSLTIISISALDEK